MLISVTGGTGFVGAHSTAAVLRAGHRVRLLVRDESAVDRALRPLGVDPGAVDVVVGSVLDRFSVDRLVRGADAVLHAASVYSFDSRARREMGRTNVAGTEQVLDTARRAGTGRIVYVSSFGALLPAAGRGLRPDSPVGRPREAYLAAKAAAEAVARSHQDAGAPVTISYPPGLLGPHDPKLGDQVTRLRNTLRGLMPVWPTGGVPIGDVRDTAALHAALLSGGGPVGGRHFGPGEYLTTRRFVATLRAVTGRALPTGYLPARAMLPLGLVTGLLQRVWPWHIPAEHGAIYTCAHAEWVADDVAARPGRPVAETIADTVRWLHGEGLLTTRAAGAVAAGRAHAA